ncbi:MAG: site-2 protease family protein, partial [Spirochaetota bacterium]
PDGTPLRLEVLRGTTRMSVLVQPSLEGVNVMSSLSGPARITWIVGNTATQGIGEGGASGLAKSFDLLAFLSIGLFIMNLLPIPALDGGQIILFAFEGIRRRPLKIKTIYRFQFTGAAIIFAIFILATVSDLIFFAS